MAQQFLALRKVRTCPYNLLNIAKLGASYRWWTTYRNSCR